MTTELDADIRREGVAVVRGELIGWGTADRGWVDDGWQERLSDFPVVE